MSRKHYEGASFLTSTSAPVSTTLEGTTATATTVSLPNAQQQREAHLRHALQHSNPTQAEVSAVASAAYVQALMELISQHSTDVQQINNKIDALQTQRESYHAELVKGALQSEAEIQELRNERSDLTLQVQEEQERSTRLLHEATVLHTQQAELKEQLGKVVELCSARGKRLRAFYHHLKKSASSAAAATSAGSRSRAGWLAQEDGSAFLECGEDAECALLNQGGTSADDVPAASLPLAKHGGASPCDFPASLSIHKASCSQAPKSLSGGRQISVKDIGNDAELAAICRLPFEFDLPDAPPSPPSPSPREAAATANTCTVTASATSTAQLLALTEEVNMLRQQLEEQRGSYEQERGARTREDNERHRRAQEQIARYAATVQHLEALHEESLRELVHYRHQTEKQLRDVWGQVEWLRSSLRDALELAEKDRRQQHNEVYATEQRISRLYYPKVQSLHSELAEYRRTSAVKTRDYAAAIAQKDEQIEELQQRLKAEASQRRRVEERHRLEMEGVHSELDLMRQSLRQMERRVYYRNVRDQASEDAGVELERYFH
ncbi:hypothetical protein ABL78_7376 [Leptomonas seymouri]|uniref:Uncharacterized protein n=1 Tax=Leptomonas seymouri TaxID=5684 RepID=A0A0N0P310_LEPSE|nr:hypothetical protein ABL78_7376 [Leptomonas seymouri]|eukprot:KPI83589.1 hypothetical protein ABL78_7376 [Leptomonas seymouri]